MDVIVSTGFGDFIRDEQLRRFYGICCDALRPGGRFVTSGMQRRRLADYLLREIAEITVYYRAPDRLAGFARESGFRSVDVQADPVGLQSLVLAST